MLAGVPHMIGSSPHAATSPREQIVQVRGLHRAVRRATGAVKRVARSPCGLARDPIRSRYEQLPVPAAGLVDGFLAASKGLLPGALDLAHIRPREPHICDERRADFQRQTVLPAVVKKPTPLVSKAPQSGTY